MELTKSFASDSGHHLIDMRIAQVEYEATQIANKKRSDLRGKKFGKWTVLSPSENRNWLCECDCGTKSLVFAGNLTSGKSKSCGCSSIGVSSSNFSDLSGLSFGALKVISRHSIIGEKPVMYLCKCSCGNECVVSQSHLKNGHTSSCGCLRKSSIRTTHGMSKTSVYRVWSAMKRRCLNQNSDSYQWYGARGISVCERWSKSFENFLLDMGLPDDPALEIDRIDTNGNYEPGNCRWVTHQENCKNRRSKNGT